MCTLVLSNKWHLKICNYDEKADTKTILRKIKIRWRN